MRVALVNTSYRFFGGAETMLLYALEELAHRELEVTVAAVEDSPLWRRLPDHVTRLALPNNERFSPAGLARQWNVLRKLPAPHVVHGWTARDWELVTLACLGNRAIPVGSLHDHPRARFITPKRQALMRWMCRIGLRRTLCVSDAVRRACENYGYPTKKLTVIRNGLPESEEWRRREPRAEDAPTRLGFLGVISQRKGALSLFEALDPVASAPNAPTFTLRIAGEAQDDEGRQILAEIHRRFEDRPWWPQVEWLGWISDPRAFLNSLDLLVAPSIAFDPFPTVLLESGFAGVPSLACRVGGVEEIVRHQETGWIYDSGDQDQFSEWLDRAIRRPDQLREMGDRAARRVRADFSIGEMVDHYTHLYQSLRAS